MIIEGVMRLNGEISDFDEEAREAEVSSLVCSIGVGCPLPQKLVVGYALTSKKKKSFLQPKLIGLARNKGILFVAIDRNRPLSDQGPFDVVLHKLSGKEWCQVVEMSTDGHWLNSRFSSCFKTLFLSDITCRVFALFIMNHDQDYRIKHPEVTVLDPPYCIQHVYNRQSMLEDVADLNLPECYGKVCVPKQLVITKDLLHIPHEVTKAGLKLPLVAKPLFVDGSAKSHELHIAYDEFSLTALEPPLVVQEFVNHGGVLFKVYIIGETIKVVRRFSLPDVSNPEISKIAGVFSFPRVSCAAASADDANLDPVVAELPPTSLLEMLANELRHRLGLRLFNVDIIREKGTRDLYYVIDINYFPGFGKMPDYEHIFTDFLLSFKQSKYKNGPPHNGEPFQVY